MVGRDITARRLLRELPTYGRLYTFSGDTFDLPRIRRHLGVDLAARLESWDLRWICRRHRLRGGQKVIERRVGYRRQTLGMGWWDAITLWWQVRAGDTDALQTLLHYNAEDIDGVRWIKRHLAGRGLLWRD
jgi:uncharacterized protein YprB with RNaseH-like and TPR domain